MIVDVKELKNKIYDRIEAINYCLTQRDCAKCPFYKTICGEISFDFGKEVSLITELFAEIEKLIEENKKLTARKSAEQYRNYKFEKEMKAVVKTLEDYAKENAYLKVMFEEKKSNEYT